MKRKIINQLIEWKNFSERKPLILQGARQIGKTYIVNEFAATQYQNYIYCNFEKETELASFFANLSPTEIIKNLSAYKRKEIIPEKTLIIFDEVQACPEAITSLKYFNEEANEYHIIALGSLLGVSVNRGLSSFPVGKIQFMNMFPMDFEEYLLAKRESFLIEKIYKCYKDNSAMEEAFHNRLMEYYKEYLFVGGMPAVVENFIKTKNSDYSNILKSDILDSYQNDMGKYNKQSEIPKTKIVYKNISTQLAKENKKFQYRQIKSGGRASEFENSIEWLCLAGIASQVFRLEHISLPLEANRSMTDFKFYMNDTGLCCSQQKLLFEDIAFENSMLNDFKGGLTENYVFTQLKAKNKDLYYWTNENQAEIDFIARIGKDIIPIEVKASDNTRSKSLTSFVKKYNPPYAIRISAKNFGFENQIKSVPLYAVFCI
ncbi:MAG: ATP-binding protein [Treponema sp.]|nr:ATP-binding protein [Treponema sp.]